MPEVLNPRTIKCGKCGSTDCFRSKDVGFDLDEEGEERQHLDECRKCGAQRFVLQKVNYYGEDKIQPGEWYHPSPDDMF